MAPNCTVSFRGPQQQTGQYSPHSYPTKLPCLAGNLTGLRQPKSKGGKYLLSPRSPQTLSHLQPLPPTPRDCRHQDSPIWEERRRRRHYHHGHPTSSTSHQDTVTHTLRTQRPGGPSDSRAADKVVGSNPRITVHGHGFPALLRERVVDHRADDRPVPASLP